MAQRIKKQAIWANREKIQKRKLSRIEKSVHIRPLLLIACEGTQTEPNYLNSYLYELIRKGVLSARSYVIAPHSHTDPCGVLNDLLSFKKDGLKYSDYERKWIFIDRDEMRTNESSGHPKDNFNTALSLAEQHQVKVAWSNPCFEFWFLLHFVYHNTPIDRAELPEKLSSFTGIEYKKNCLKMYEILRDKLVDAIRNAQKLEEFSTQDPCDANPMTTVFHFFEENNIATYEDSIH